MTVQLLLLLALVGPFCGFTHASPTVVPTDLDVGITETVADVAPDTTEAPKDFSVVTGPPATNPAVAPEEVVTEAVTAEAPPSTTVNTETPIIETETPAAAATATPEHLITDPPAVETAAPTEAAGEVQPSVTAAAEAGPSEDVVIEEDTEEDLSSGQVVGIVIGALLAVVIVIAVVIAVVRRMGKYSP